MKKIFLTIVILSLFSSCNLAIEPENAVTISNYFKSEKDLEALVTTMMANQRNMYASVDGSVHDILSMETDLSDFILGGRLMNIAAGFKQLDPSFYLANDFTYYFQWKEYYDNIYIANTIIENEFRYENIKKDRADFWIMQANFFKAQAYFELARNWGDAPIVKNTVSAAKLGKSPQKELFMEAIRCAELAMELPTHENIFDASGKKIDYRQFANKGTVYTLLSYICATMGGLYDNMEYWTKAEKYASEVIEKKVGYYELEPTIADLCRKTLGKERKSNETIFSILFSDLDTDYSLMTVTPIIYPMMRAFTAPVFAEHDPTNVLATNFYAYVQARYKVTNILALYDEEEDIRRTEYWHMLGREAEYCGDASKIIYYAYPNKWKADQLRYNTNVDMGGRNYIGIDADKVVWRLADLILLRAECRARLNMASAVDDLNRVRNRAGLGRYSEGGDIRRAVFKERQRELFGEGHRFNDAVRNGYLSEISEEFGTLSETDISRGALYYPVTKPAFEKNDLMTQNTFWLWKK